MKKYLFLFVIISLLFFKCSEDSNPVENGNDNSLVVTGRVSSYNGNFNKVYTSSFPNSDSLLIVETEMKADGSFNLKIPLPSENQLSYYTPISRISVINGDSTIFIDSIQIADSNFKYIRYDLFAQSSSPITYALDISLAKITNTGEFAKVGDYYVSYYYFNSNTKVEGYYKLKIVTADSTREWITNFNVNTKIGWNKLLTKFTSEVPNKSVYEVTNITVELGNWIIGAKGSFLRLGNF